MMCNAGNTSFPSSPALAKTEKVKSFSQRGFTEGKSCLVCLITTCREVAGLVDTGTGVGVVYLGFDIASCNILVEKLMMRGLDEQAVRWIENCSTAERREG